MDLFHHSLKRMKKDVGHEFLYVVRENCDMTFDILRIFHILFVAFRQTVFGDEVVTRVQRNKFLFDRCKIFQFVRKLMFVSQPDIYLGSKR